MMTVSANNIKLKQQTSDNAKISELRVNLHRISDKDKNSRLTLRLMVVLLLLEKHSSKDIAQWFGENERTLLRWKKTYLEQGIKGLNSLSRKGRPAKLSPHDTHLLYNLIKQSPRDYGFSSKQWHGKELQTYIKQQLKINLSLRQCQRFLHDFKEKDC